MEFWQIALLVLLGIIAVSVLAQAFNDLAEGVNRRKIDRFRVETGNDPVDWRALDEGKA